MKPSRRPALLVTLLIIAAASVGCLRSFSAVPGTGPDGKPTVQTCADWARAQPSAAASGPSVAVALPTVAPSASAAPEGVLRHAQ